MEDRGGSRAGLTARRDERTVVGNRWADELANLELELGDLPQEVDYGSALRRCWWAPTSGRTTHRRQD